MADVNNAIREKMKQLFNSEIALKNLEKIDYSKDSNSYRLENYTKEYKKETTITKELLATKFSY